MTTGASSDPARQVGRRLAAVGVAFGLAGSVNWVAVQQRPGMAVALLAATTTLFVMGAALDSGLG